MREQIREPVRAEEIDWASIEAAMEADEDGVSAHHVDPALIPDGMTYQWKRYSVLGKVDEANYTLCLRRGWRPVPAGRLPEYCMPGTDPNASIINDGLILMERPTAIQRKAEAIENRKAAVQRDEQKKQLGETPSGQLPRTRPSVRTELQPIEDE